MALQKLTTTKVMVVIHCWRSKPRPEQQRTILNSGDAVFNSNYRGEDRGASQAHGLASDTTGGIKMLVWRSEAEDNKREREGEGELRVCTAFSEFYSALKCINRRESSNGISEDQLILLYSKDG